MSNDHPNNEEGRYPRLNSSMLNTGKWVGCLVSLVGKVVNRDEDGKKAILECSDGGKVTVHVDKDFKSSPEKVIEVMGSMNEDMSIQVRINCLIVALIITHHL